MAYCDFPLNEGIRFYFLGAIIGIAGSALAAAAASKSASTANKRNVALVDRQNQWNLEQWNRENEYNSPIRQMERIKAAGLNPNLVYGEGVTGNSSSTVRSGTYPSTEQADTGKFIAEGAQQLGSMIQQQEQFDAKLKQDGEIAEAQLEVEKEKNNINRSRTESQNRNTDIDTDFKRDSYDSRLRSLELENDIRSQKLENDKLTGQLTQAQIAHQNLATLYLEEKYKMLPKEAQLLTERIRGQIWSNVLASDSHKLNSIAIEIADKTKDAKIQTALAQATTEQEKARVVAQYYEQEIMQRIAQGDIKLEESKREGDEFHFNVMGVDVGRIYQSFADSFGLTDYYYPASYESYSSRYKLN